MEAMPLSAKYWGIEVDRFAVFQARRFGLPLFTALLSLKSIDIGYLPCGM